MSGRIFSHSPILLLLPSFISRHHHRTINSITTVAINTTTATHHSTPHSINTPPRLPRCPVRLTTTTNHHHLTSSPPGRGSSTGKHTTHLNIHRYPHSLLLSHRRRVIGGCLPLAPILILPSPRHAGFHHGCPPSRLARGHAIASGPQWSSSSARPRASSPAVVRRAAVGGHERGGLVAVRYEVLRFPPGRKTLLTYVVSFRELCRSLGRP